VDDVIAGITERIKALVIGQDKNDVGPVCSALLGLINRLVLIASRGQETQGKQNNCYHSHVFTSI
jgi:hypothetical protein